MTHKTIGQTVVNIAWKNDNDISLVSPLQWFKAQIFKTKHPLEMRLK